MEYVAEPQSKWTGDSYSYTETVSYYEPTSYFYDLTLENAQVLAEYAGIFNQTKVICGAPKQNKKHALPYMSKTGRIVSFLFMLLEVN